MALTRQVKRPERAFRVQAILFVSFTALNARRICRFQVNRLKKQKAAELTASKLTAEF
jgi:hypothetical protein